MTKKRRIVLLCLAVLMMAAVAVQAVPARAADPLTLTVSEVEGTAGTQVLVDVSLSGNTGITVLEFSVAYDASKMDYSKWDSVNKLSGTIYEREKGLISYAWDDVEGYPRNGSILTLAFDVKSDAEGNAQVGFVTDGSLELYAKMDKTTLDLATQNGGVLLPRTDIFTDVSLSLDSDISLNYYVDLNRDERLNGEMKFFVGDERSFVADIRYNTKEGKYYCNCPLNVLEMAMDVRAEFTYGEKTYEKTWSVPQYIEAVMKGDYSTATKTLAAKIANYGYYAQQYLAAIHPSTVTLGENGYPIMEADSDNPLNAADALALMQDDLTLSGDGTNGTTLYGRSVYFDHAMGMNYYVQVESGEMPEVTVPDGRTPVVKLYRGNIFHVSVGDISVTDLKVPVSVTANGMTCASSPLGCCAAIANKNGADSPAGKAMASLYEYYIAANTYAASL